MSRGMRDAATALVAAALLAAAHMPAAAQSAAQARPDTEAAIVAEIDRLLPEAERLRAEAEARRAREEALRNEVPRPTLDSARVGPFTVAARPPQLDEAVEAFRAAWDEVDPLLSADAFPEGLTFLYERSEKPTLTAPEGVLKVDVFTWGKATDPMERAESALRQVVTDRVLPGVIQRWIRRAHLDVDRAGDVYRELVFARSDVGRACVEGSVSACWSALGLGGEEDPLQAWYSEAQYEAAVARDADGVFASIRRCEEQGFEEDCRSAWSWYWNWVDAIPASREVRAHFLAFALRAGPPDALDRFVATGWSDPPRPEPPSEMDAQSYQEWQATEYRDWLVSRVQHPPNLGPTVRERLRIATGTDPDVLMSRWMDEVLEPEGRIAEEPVRSSTFFWILFFSALATRSTRWRLG